MAARAESRAPTPDARWKLLEERRAVGQRQSPKTSQQQTRLHRQFRLSDAAWTFSADQRGQTPAGVRAPPPNVFPRGLALRKAGGMWSHCVLHRKPGNLACQLEFKIKINDYVKCLKVTRRGKVLQSVQAGSRLFIQEYEPGWTQASPLQYYPKSKNSPLQA